ncbi:helix-turn-helix transcriptional regulator [Nocardiopsis suaedae]|uniref:Helix-turn-helix transcriptional regulator n=1 Tax=Nocardiopsis suaedae TaxID=3018444 RepID=A0ABT4TSC7_9ACTN|nr:helix-turn-helix transcriptional regulator [Nocardiopsis suaedae]MDA2807588.1 helix-turn-helix transcriptional regulator [Nocardiopsis suaedae]
MDGNSELGGFLRSRRARLSPQEAGAPLSGGVRRVPGLRREEVAHLAGVSTDYYTRLEQGRHPHVSESVLSAVARALRLDGVERDHLFELARPRTDAGGSGAGSGGVQRVRPEVHRMLEVFNGVTPALVVNHRKDVLAANRLARALIADFEALPYRERNLARHVLLEPDARELYADWEGVAEEVVANLRLSSGRHPEDRLLNELVGEFMAKVPEFAGWWDRHRVGQCSYGPQRFRHPVVGALTLQHETLALPADEGQTVCVYTAEPGSESERTLGLLASWSMTDGTPDTAPDRGGSGGRRAALERVLKDGPE